DRGDDAVRKSLGIEPGGFFGCTVVPEANHVLSHRVSLLTQSVNPSWVRRKSATEIDGGPRRTYGRAPAISDVRIDEAAKAAVTPLAGMRRPSTGSKATQAILKPPLRCNRVGEHSCDLNANTTLNSRE